MKTVLSKFDRCILIVALLMGMFCIYGVYVSYGMYLDNEISYESFKLGIGFFLYASLNVIVLSKVIASNAKKIDAGVDEK